LCEIQDRCAFINKTNSRAEMIVARLDTAVIRMAIGSQDPALVPDHPTTVTVRNNLVTMRAQREKEGSQKGSRGFFPTAAAAQS